MFKGELKALISVATLKKNPSLIPAVITLCGGFMFTTSYIIYMCTQKNDISFKPSNWRGQAPYDYVRPDQKTVFYQVKGKQWDIDPEVIKTRREIGSLKV